MSFHEVRFPASLSFGSVGGPERRTNVVTLANGYEERNTPWAHSRRRYDAGLGMRSLEDLEQLIAFFEARRGRMFGFRWKDWSDFKSSTAAADIAFDDQIIGEGDGITTDIPLIKTYVSGEHHYIRPISKPVAGRVRVGLAGAELFEGVDYSVDTAMGLLQFSSPPDAGAPITAGFEFDVPVRFDTETIQVSVESFQVGEVPAVPVVEVRT